METGLELGPAILAYAYGKRLQEAIRLDWEKEKGKGFTLCPNIACVFGIKFGFVS